MIRYRKTYCKYGLIEWMGCIHAGALTMSVRFAGGSQTAYGVNPALFTTEDLFTQRFIEMSDEFKNGSIRLLRYTEIGVDEPVSAELNKEFAKDASVHEGDAETANNGCVEIEVSDKNEAIEYLKEHYDKGYTATKLRTKSDFEAACMECGVRFVFTE